MPKRIVILVICVVLCATSFLVFGTVLISNLSKDTSTVPVSTSISDINWDTQATYEISTVSFEMHEAFSDRTLPAFDPRNYCLLLGIKTEDGDELVHTSLDKVYLKPNVTKGTTPKSTLLIDGCSMLVVNPDEFSSMLTTENFIELDDVQIQFCLAYLLYPNGKSSQ